MNRIQKARWTKYNVFTDGLKIYTTIDYKMQAVHAGAAMREHMIALQKKYSQCGQVRTMDLRCGWREKAIRKITSMNSIVSRSGFGIWGLPIWVASPIK